MDYSNRVGSKKGGGGIASASIENLYRKKQIDNGLVGENIPFATASSDQAGDEDELKRKNPYIYKNNSGKLVCKLCNTMHVSWTSVERHLKGKKHGLNLIKRSGSFNNNKNNRLAETEKERIERDILQKKEKKLEVIRDEIKGSEILPVGDFQMCNVVNSDGDEGILIKIQYGEQRIWQDNTPPFVRIINGLEVESNKEVESDEKTSSEVKTDKNYLSISFPPYETIAVEIPSDKEITFHNQRDQKVQYESAEMTIDEINKKACFWDKDNNQLFIQLFFH